MLGISATRFRLIAATICVGLGVGMAQIAPAVAATQQVLSLWSAGVQPEQTAATDGSTLELGVRFLSDTSGSVLGVRFFKGSGNRGTHTASLWDKGGARLARATVTNETSSGWQSVTFGRPVAIVAGRPYTVSYYAPLGHYAISHQYFQKQGVNNPPLHASGTGNGVYHYGSSGFPTDSAYGSNYWVDVLFAPTSNSADTTPPTVLSVSPPDASGGVALTASISATFSEALQPGSTLMSVRTAGGVAVAGTVSENAAARQVTFQPAQSALRLAMSYTVSVSGARDAAGNTMTSRSWTFTTADAPPPPPLPGGRDKLRWPFAATSVWNMPVGAGAQYVGVGFQPPAQGYGVDEEPVVMAPSAPLRKVYENSIWPASCQLGQDTGVMLPVPDGYTITAQSGFSGTQPNFAGGILAADGQTIVDGQAVTRCSTGGPVTMFAKRASYSIYGDGRPSFGGHGGSGMSSVGGSIRVGELTGSSPMRHAVKLTVDCERYCHGIDGANPGYRWPAVAADEGQPYGSLAAAPPVGMGMGSLLAIPANVDLAGLSLQTAPARQLAWTLQNYGAYVVDNAGPDGGRWDRELLDVETGVYTEVRAAGVEMETWNNGSPTGAWHTDLNRIFATLALVSNNRSDVVGGGGTPRQPLAPPISN